MYHPRLPQHFRIQLTGDNCVHAGEQCARGIIQVNGFHEELFIPIEAWSRDDYTRQWSDAIEMLRNDAPATCLVTAMPSQSRQNSSTKLWIIYRQGDLALVQKHMVPSSHFASGSVYSLIVPRRTHDDSGERIPEWIVPLSGITSFDVAPLQRDLANAV